MKIRVFLISLPIIYAAYAFTQNNSAQVDINKVTDITNTGIGNIKKLNKKDHSGYFDPSNPDYADFSDETKKYLSDDRRIGEKLLDYRPIEDEQNIGNQVQGSSRYDKKIQSIHDIENIEEFRRIERNDEIKNILVNVFVGLAIIAFMITLVFTSRETKK